MRLHAPQVSRVQNDLELDSLNILSDEINFDKIDDDLEAFQEDEMVQSALKRGIDLKRYGMQLENELRVAEMECVSQYVQNNGFVVDLHTQMQDCDAILARMQEMLVSFQSDLGGISEEIKHLQDESLSMSIKLRNRRAAEDKLHFFLDHATITPEMAESIVSPDTSEVFLGAVVALKSAIKYLKQREPVVDGSKDNKAPAETYAGRHLIPTLHKLKVRSIAKIKDYFTNQFNALRKPKTNVQVFQQSSLLKYAALLEFLNEEAQPMWEDLRVMYVESMGRTLLSLFKSYTLQLLKLDIVVASKNDLIAIEEAMLKSMFSNKVDLTKRMDSFSLSDRDKILEQVDFPPILLHVALAEAQRFPFEAILRSVIKHLSDAATNEFLFVLDFFRRSPTDTFNRIFGRTLSLILETLENYLLSCYDAVGLLLMIKVTHAQRLVMQRRRIPILDPFFDRISLLLWPRLKSVLDANLKSVKAAQCKKLGPVDLSPHYVSKRYAELVASIMSLHRGIESMGVGGGGESMLQHDLHVLRVEITALLGRLSELLESPKERKVFFINNFDQILSVFQERRAHMDEIQKFDDALMRQRELFAEEEIRASFPRLVSFVSQTEQAIAEEQLVSGSSAAGAAGLQLDELLVESLVREFATGWRAGIQQINDNVLAYFADFRNGMEILKQVLTQLLLYYTRFQDIIKKSSTKPQTFSRDLVSTATILMEIKRYSRTF